MDVRWIALTAGVCSVLLLMGIAAETKPERQAGRSGQRAPCTGRPCRRPVWCWHLRVGRMVVYWLALALTAVLFLLWFFLRVCRSC